ncbi:MAG: inorganic diphosphatase [Candidatus Makana argininalis]
MSLYKISSGKKIPDDIYVIIEIPCNSHHIKYEVDKKSGALFINRIMNNNMIYPCNYGYINNTLSLDGDPLDVLVILNYFIYPGTVIRCRPIGLLRMIDESGEDNKLIAVPHIKISQDYNNIYDINDLSKNIKNQIVHFFKHYKDLEKNKWIKINGWDDVNAAKSEIIVSLNRSKVKNKNKK